MWRYITGSIAILGLIFCITFTAIWHEWWYPKNYEYVLRLADDASLPGTKAEYLEQYLAKVATITGPPRYTWKRPDLDLEKQKVILEGLIQRFKDIAKLDPGEMAYQQGMFQLTGQEIDHQLDRISGIFKSAKLRENWFVFFLQSWAFLIFTALLLISIKWDV